MVGHEKEMHRYVVLFENMQKNRIKCGSFHIAFQKMNAYNGLKYDGNAERAIGVWKSISGRLSDI